MNAHDLDKTVDLEGGETLRLSYDLDARES